MEGKKLQEVGEKRGNHMTLQQLKYAILVAESRSMSEAARKSFVSQPAHIFYYYVNESGCDIILPVNKT